MNLMFHDGHITPYNIQPKSSGFYSVFMQGSFSTKSHQQGLLSHTVIEQTSPKQILINPSHQSCKSKVNKLQNH